MQHATLPLVSVVAQALQVDSLLQQMDAHSACTHSLLPAQGPRVQEAYSQVLLGAILTASLGTGMTFFCALDTPSLCLGTPVWLPALTEMQVGNGTSSTVIIQFPKQEHLSQLHDPLTLPLWFWNTVEEHSLFLFGVW